MPTKRRRSPSLEGDHARLNNSIAHLTGYQTLPVELRQHIFELACLARPTTSASDSRRLYDTATCLSLILVSRELSEQVRPYLWAQVSITRPSALYALREAIVAHPERGRLIRHLHIGSQTALPPHWWPLGFAWLDGEGYMPSSGGYVGRPYNWLASSLNQADLPSGCDDRQKWSLVRPTSGCRQAAIAEALQVAESALNIDLLKEGIGAGDLRIGTVLEVQAALDLYLARLRADEEANPSLQALARPGSRVPLACRNGNCEHYPALVITDTELELNTPSRLRKRQPRFRPGALILRRSELLHQLTRPGSVTDRFDHPLMLYRSGFGVQVTQARGKGHQDHREGKGARYTLTSDREDVIWHEVGDDWPDFNALAEAEDHEVFFGSGKSINGRLLDTATLGSNLHMARDVLKSSPSLQNLSLTGFFERAVGIGTPKLPRLRRLTIGPPPPCWNAQLYFDGLSHLQELRIGGQMLGSAEVASIVNMRQLRELEWSLGEPSYHSVAAIVGHLVDGTIPDETPPSSPRTSQDSHSDSDSDETAAQPSEPHTSGPELPADGSSSEEASYPIFPQVPAQPAAHHDSQDASQPSDTAPLPLITVRLDTSDAERMLATADSAQVREAWLQGREVPGKPRRLHVIAENTGFTGRVGSRRGTIRASFGRHSTKRAGNGGFVTRSRRAGDVGSSRGNWAA